MNTNQLQILFSALPTEILERFQNREFKTCWYTSSSVDKRPMVFTDHTAPNAQFNDCIEVFFYNDIDFFIRHNALFVGHFGGRVFFNNDTPFVVRFDDTCMPLDYHGGYALRGEILGGEITLNHGNILPPSRAFINQHAGMLSDKMLLKARYEQFWDIYADLLPREYECEMDFEATELLNYMVEVGLMGEEYRNNKKIIKDFINLRSSLRPLKEEELLNFSNYEFKAILVKHLRHNGDPFFTFYIDADNHSFEHILLQNGLKVNYAVHSLGWAGHGPSEAHRETLGWQSLNINW